jgi:hypothetical protein
MSGGGLITEKTRLLIEHARDVVRYRVLDVARDEYIMALPADEEPEVGETMWWSADAIYWGPNDSKRLIRVGFSWTAQG